MVLQNNGTETDAGDIFQGTPYFNLYGGEPELRIMSKMGYDAATIGNHDFDFGSVDSPMGGMRSSGLGRRQGPEGIHRFTEPQTVATQRVLPIRPVLGLSERVYAQTMTATLRALKRLHRA